MSSALWIDIYTHNPVVNDETFFIQNLGIEYFEQKLELPKHNFSLGLNPIFSEQAPPNYLNYLKEVCADNYYCNALGAIGLDKFHQVDYELQKVIFIEQLKVAKEIKIPVVILHCVHAYYDILPILKNIEYGGKYIFHDFNGTYEQYQNLMELPSFFSFGTKIFNGQSKAANAIKEIPIEKIFLETAEQKRYSIQEIYQEASNILSIERISLKNQMEKNLKALFS